MLLPLDVILFISLIAEYNSICGKLRGYQKGSPDGFAGPITFIDKQYLDGVSITVGTVRKHV